MKKLYILVLMLGSASCFAQQRLQRLVAIARYYDSSWNGSAPMVIFDSVSMSYSGDRHSRFDFNELDYFNPSSLHDASIIMKQSSILRPNNIDSGQYSVQASHDSMRYFYCAPYTPAPILQYLETCDYYTDGWPHIARRLAYDYNGNCSWDSSTYRYFYGDLISVNNFSGNNTGYLRDEGDRFLIRDAFGNVVIDSNGSNVIKYEYDDAGRYTSRSTGQWMNGSFQYPNTVFYDYYDDGMLRTRKTGPAQTYQIDSFEYTPGVPGYTKLTSFDFDGVRRSLKGQYKSHVNLRGLKDTMWKRDPVLGVYEVIAVAYNAFGNPVSRTGYKPISNYGNVDAYKDFYYYEDYIPSLSVAITATTPPSVTLSPNPTAGAITLHGLPQARISIRITSMMGQLVHSESFTPQGTNSNITLGSEVVPGVYSICVFGSGNAPLYRGTFLKK